MRAAPDRKAVSLPAWARDPDGSGAFGQSKCLVFFFFLNQYLSRPQAFGALIILSIVEFSWQMSSLDVVSGWILESFVLSHPQRRLLTFTTF